MQIAVRVETSNDLVLRWHVELLHDLVKLVSELDIFSIEGGNLTVFLREQEFQILHLVLRLAACSFPLEISAVSMLSILNQLEMEVVVFLDDALVLHLERFHGLTVQAGLIGNHGVLILEFLEGLSRL